nr:transglycosylase SLT domain-containing protein [uncultured Roseateles sp.]
MTDSPRHSVHGSLPRLLPLLTLLLAACATTAPVSTVPSENTTTPSVALSSNRSVESAPVTRASAAAFDQMSAALLEDSLQPGAKIDLDDSQAQADLWARVRKGFALQDLDGELVGKAEQWYSTRPDYVQRMTERGSRYLYHIIEEVEKRGMPAELALLPFVESAFNPQAMSTAKASGMWQFVPATGRDFALKQNVFRDDRRDVLASTRAALDYLDKLHGMFGDWHLALAAYNWGQGNVQKAIARNEKAGLPTDYLSLRMPDETRYYIPKLQAVKNIIARPDTYGLSLPPVANHPFFLSVKIDRDMDVDVAARLAGLEVDDFKLYNPQMNKPVILAAGTQQVLLPYDNASHFVRRLASHQGPLASWTAWVAPRTLKPAEAAKLVGMSEAALSEINKIPPRMLVKQGSTLLVPRGLHRLDDVSEHLAENASITLAPDVPPLQRVAFKAGKGDTLAGVAKRYRVSSEQLASWNKLNAKSALKAGQTLVVYTAATPVRTASVGKNLKPARKVLRTSGRSTVALNTIGAPATRQLSRR